jgi:hypothetical protein
MYLLGIASVTATYLVATPIAAAPQDEDGTEATAEAPMLSEAQQADYDSWAPEQQAAYAVWPEETKVYYWTLEPERQMLFWRLTDEDKIALTAMTGPEREASWGQIEGNTGSAPPGR